MTKDEMIEKFVNIYGNDEKMQDDAAVLAMLKPEIAQAVIKKSVEKFGLVEVGVQANVNLRDAYLKDHGIDLKVVLRDELFAEPRPTLHSLL